jgi:hypothetical protein
MKKLFKILLILGGILLVLVVAATIAVNLFFPQEKVKNMIVPEVAKAVNREVKLEKISVSVFPSLKLHLKGLSISNTSRKGFDNKTPFVQMGEFTLKFNWRSIIKRQIDIDTIHFDNLQLLVEKNRAGSFNFDDMNTKKGSSAEVKKNAEKKEAEPPAPDGKGKKFELPEKLRVALNRFEISNSSIVVVDKSTDQTIVIGNISQKMSFQMDSQLTDIKTVGEIILKGVRVMAKGVPRDVDELNIKLKHDIAVNLPAQTVTIKNVSLSLQKFVISLNGLVKNFETVPEYDIKLASNDITFEELLREIPASLVPEIKKLKAKGGFKIDVAAQGKADPAKKQTLPTVNGKIMVKDVSIKYADFPKSLDEMQADISFTEKNLKINSLKMLSGKDIVDVKASVDDFQNPLVDANINVNVDLGGIKDLAPLPQGVSLKGLLVSHMQLSGRADPNDPTKLTANGRVELNNIEIVTPEVTSPVNLSGNLELSNKAINLAKLAVKIGDSSLLATASIRDYLNLALKKPGQKAAPTMIDFTVDSPNWNVDSMMKKTEKKATPTDEGQPSDDGAMDKPIEVAKLPNVIMKGQIKFAKLRASSLDFTNLVATLNYKDGIFDVATKSNLYTGMIEHNAKLDLTQKKGLKLSQSFNLDKLEANDFISHFNDSLTVKPTRMKPKLFDLLKELDNVVYGKLTMKSSFATMGETPNLLKKNLTGKINADIFDGKIMKNMMLGAMQSTGGKANKLLERLGKGSLPFDGGQIDFKKLTSAIRIENENVVFDTIDALTPRGDWKVDGKLGFDTSINFNVAVKLTKDMSTRLTALQGKTKGAAKKMAGALEGRLGAGLANRVENLAENAVDEGTVDADKDGRVTLNIGLTGLARTPKAVWRGFGKASASPASGSAQESLSTGLEKGQQQAETAVKAKTDELQQKGTAELTKQKDAANQKAKQEAAKAKKKAEQEAGKAKKKATDKARQLLNF